MMEVHIVQVRSLIPYPGAEVLERGSVASGSGPIFLSDLNCEGTETSLLQCMRQDNQPTGLHNCVHQQDVAIRCTGNTRLALF